MKRLAAVMGLIAGAARVLQAQAVGPLTGSVRDTAGALLAGAEVLLDNRRTTTTPQGTFRFDSLRVGTHLITIRLVGFVALRSPVTVRSEGSRYDFVLRPAAHVLPTVYAEARKQGIYGTVGDTAFRPLADVKIQVAGRGGGDAFTDSSGRFAFPSAIEGQYVVRAVLAGYAEERLFIEVRKREGVELAIRLRPSNQLASRVDQVAVQELGLRLAANLSRDRLNATQLSRYGSLGLCDVNRIAASLRRGMADSLTIILNGTFVLEKMSVHDVCSWRADEVELVEFGDDICRDVTRTLVNMLNVWCEGFTKRRDATTGGRFVFPGGGGRIRTQRQPGPFVVIWERR